MNTSTIVILAHGTSKSRSIEELEKFLLGSENTIVKIVHPLEGSSRKFTSISRSNYSELIERSNFGALNYLIDLSLSVQLMLGIKNDLYIAVTNWDCIAALIVKRLFNRSSKLKYMPRDFSTKKYKSRILNWFYMLIEKISVRFADETISNTHRAAASRMMLGLNESKSVVMTNPVESPRNFNNKEIDKSNFIYVGELTDEHGLLDIVRVLKPIIKQLTIVGYGPHMDLIRDYCKKYSINTEIYENKTKAFVMDKLADFQGFGLAPYNNRSSWTYYCSPLKVSEYVVNGVPPIISNVPEMSQEILYTKLGVVYETLELNTLIDSIANFSSTSYMKKAKEYYTLHSYNRIYKDLIE